MKETNSLAITQTAVQNPSDCNASTAGAINCIVKPKFRHEIIDEESDGVVPVSSQTGYPGALIAPKMVDCNHMQERNHAETRKRLNELFNGAYGREFELDEI
ncbi:MAG: hypothetical protein ACPGVV_01420 [Croceimicrobium sp.]